MSKELKNIKTTTGIVLINKEPRYVMRVRGLYIESRSNPFMSKDSDESTEILDVVITNKDDEIVFVPIIDQFKGKRINSRLFKHLPEKVTNYIKDDWSNFNGIYSDGVFKIPTSYTENVLEDIKTKVDISPLIESNKALEEYLKEIKKIEKEDSLLEFIEKYAFKEHILISGERGLGKTYTVDKYLREQGDVEIEFIGCHNAVESIDLLGYYVRSHDGSFVWLDGALSGSFRKASKGQKVALFMDEILRMPSRELNILVAALTPDSGGYFNLRTNRIVNTEDGVGEVELLRVPKDKLWVVGTTNIGSDYDNSELDIAFQDRFMTKEINISIDTIRDILSNYTEDEDIINKLINVYEKVEALVNAEELSHKLNVRHLVKVINYSINNTELKQYLLDFIPNVCSRNIDGKFNKVEVELYKEVIKGI